MKYIIILLSVLSMTGCASNCTHACLFGIGPGNSAFDSVADYHDKNDPCQFKGKEQGYELPYYCGASKGKVVRVNKAGYNTYIVNRY